MDVHVYSCPFRTGLIYCDIRTKGEHVRSTHASVFNAYLVFAHLDTSRANINIDVPGENLEKLRERYKNQSCSIGSFQ
jgi:hypothetical protein